MAATVSTVWGRIVSIVQTAVSTVLGVVRSMVSAIAAAINGLLSAIRARQVDGGQCAQWCGAAAYGAGGIARAGVCGVGAHPGAGARAQSSAQPPLSRHAGRPGPAARTSKRRCPPSSRPWRKRWPGGRAATASPSTSILARSCWTASSPTARTAVPCAAVGGNSWIFWSLTAWRCPRPMSIQGAALRPG